MHYYPIPSSRSKRLYGYDYGKAGAYFITICTKNRYPFFGHIESGKLNSTTAAILTQNIWEQIPSQFPFVELDEFVVMPDHIHGIIIIHEPQDPVESEQKTGGFAGHQNPMLHQNLSRIIRWYKGRCTFEIRKSDASFTWQSNYHDHIIRDTEAYDRICQYIKDNPKNHTSN
ncbi:transposase [Fluviicola sp.]|uniref:transposase n=1 Tax=Fluviicola sp. TaxID=1917219 RepID=UPI0031D57FD3